MTTRILIADDQEGIRMAFRIILDAQPDMTVVGEAPDGVAALDLARRLRPDVVLADIRMPGMDGLRLTEELAGQHVRDPIRVIVVTTFDLDDYVITALASGACGFILKRSGPTLLIEAIRAAVAGDTLISPQVTVRLLRHLRHAPQRPQVSRAAMLSDREAAVARLVARGQTNIEVAAELYISPATVKGHIANIQRKLGVRNRVGIAMWAWENGQVGPASGHGLSAGPG